ncbi:MAG: hypothetical protein HY707_07765 [Ignavibacteriae bacterium]|nr:hypothetical protein [Ignavibacteriota bacterium]
MRSRESSFVRRLKTLTEALPSPTEKEEIRRDIQELIDFLKMLSEAVARIPTSEDTLALRRSLDDIEKRLETDKRAILLNLVNLRKKSPITNKPLSTGDIEQGRKDLDTLSKLDFEELKQTLKDEKAYPIKRIRAILEALGVHVSSKKIRSELSDLVVTKISNYKGYESLRNK